jgi:hypothetical protein
MLDKIYITKIEKNYYCDVFIDRVPDNFIIESQSEIQQEN